MEGYSINWFLTRIVTVNTLLLGMLVVHSVRPDLSMWAYFFVSFISVLLYNTLIIFMCLIMDKVSKETWFENRRINIRITGTILYDKENID